ncbi:MAG: MerR family transcriptional regulator [Acidobacteria bacterium]|nr:MAG: MerR family transcriptional regulator [Acidobacteriota bacterium]TDI54049.1 MAG: MerR family transcriptional regulator [Acidobacteriota bacterium]
MPDTKALSIGEVINLLREDFPDVSVSKIRFLESQGLIDPGRSSSRYRQFDPDDIARLRFILAQQRDHFLPLKVIKSKLTLWERGEEGEVVGSLSRTPLDESGEPLDREDLIKRSGLTEEELEQLVEVGLIRPIPNSTVFPPEAGVVGVEAKRLMDHGLEPRHLRSIRLSVDRESDLLTQLVAPLLRSSNAEARARAKDVLESCSDSVRAMHRALMSAELRQQISS